jgi:sugar lactone lactonase YvrE
MGFEADRTGRRVAGRGLWRAAALAFVALSLLLAVASPGSTADRSPYPEVIPLPTGFQPEGIVVGAGSSFFVGSLVDGTIWKGDLRTGRGEVLVTPSDVRTAVGMDDDRGGSRLFVAGGPFGAAYVYDTRTGETLASYQLTGELTFVNDVIVTRDAAYFTDSFRPVLYKLPLGRGGALPDQSEIEEISLTGDYQLLEPLLDFLPINSNGIVATPSGKWLIIAHTALGKLYRVDPATGEATEIDLGGAAVPSGDGLVLAGRTLYVVQNFLNQIGVVDLDPGFTTGTVGEAIVSEAFRIPTTADRFGSSLYAVNARFDVAPPPFVGTLPSPGVEFEVVKVGRER